jgi:hypothetical protein
MVVYMFNATEQSRIGPNPPLAVVMTLKGLMRTIFTKKDIALDRQNASTERVEHAAQQHQRPRRRSSITMYTAQSRLENIIHNDPDPYYAVQTLGKELVLTSSIVVSALFFETLAPTGFTAMVVPLLQGIIESKKDTHSIAVLSELLFEFMIPAISVLPHQRTDLLMMSNTLAKDLHKRISSDGKETKEALTSARERILPKIDQYLEGSYVNTITFTLPPV